MSGYEHQVSALKDYEDEEKFYASTSVREFDEKITPKTVRKNKFIWFFILFFLFMYVWI